MREERAQMKKMMPEKNAGQIQKHEVVTGEKLDSNKTQGACPNTIRICDLSFAGSGDNGHGQTVTFYWVDADNGPTARCVNLRCNQAQIAGFYNTNIGGLPVKRCGCGLKNFGLVQAAEAVGGGSHNRQNGPYTSVPMWHNTANHGGPCGVGKHCPQVTSNCGGNWQNCLHEQNQGNLRAAFCLQNGDQQGSQVYFEMSSFTDAGC